jgi:FkbM family methyltransferase
MTVVDVGTANGDSAIYFAVNGADRVIALEPDPLSSALAGSSIDSSGLRHRIMVVAAGLGARSGNAELLVSGSFPNANSVAPPTTWRERVHYNGSRTVEILTLAEVLQRFQLDHIDLLKLTCVGCEYEVLRSLPREVLDRVGSLVVQFHSGIQDLEELLREAGFRTSYALTVGEFGLLRAWRT